MSPDEGLALLESGQAQETLRLAYSARAQTDGARRARLALEAAQKVYDLTADQAREAHARARESLAKSREAIDALAPEAPEAPRVTQ